MPDIAIITPKHRKHQCMWKRGFQFIITIQWVYISKWSRRRYHNINHPVLHCGLHYVLLAEARARKAVSSNSSDSTAGSWPMLRSLLALPVLYQLSADVRQTNTYSSTECYPRMSMSMRICVHVTQARLFWGLGFLIMSCRRCCWGLGRSPSLNCIIFLRLCSKIVYILLQLLIIIYKNITFLVGNGTN